MPRHIRLPRQPMHAHAAPMDRLRAIAAGLRRPQTAAQAIAEARTRRPLPEFERLDAEQRRAIRRATVEVMQGKMPQ